MSALSPAQRDEVLDLIRQELLELFKESSRNKMVSTSDLMTGKAPLDSELVWRLENKMKPKAP
jgi:hypothetical protein